MQYLQLLQNYRRKVVACLSLFLVIFNTLNCLAQDEVFRFSTRNPYKISNYKLENISGVWQLRAVDNESDSTDKNINTNYSFVINGIVTNAVFANGVSSLPKSDTYFWFFKHDNGSKTIQKLYLCVGDYALAISGLVLWLLIAVVAVICYYLGKIVRMALFVISVFMLLKFVSGFDWHTYSDVVFNALGLSF